MADELSEYPAPVEPPFYGTGPLITWDPNVLLDAVDRNRLLKSIRGDAGNQEFGPALDAMINGIKRDRLFEPAGLYGYFPVITDDDLVIILDPADFFTERVTLRFPRMPEKGDLSMADYLRPEGDVLGIQVVTTGRGMHKRCQDKPADPGSKEPGKLLKALADHLVKDLANRVAIEITRGPMLPAAGLCVNFGTPGMPVFEEQRELFEFLAIEERIGVSFTNGPDIVSNCWRSGIYFHK